MRERAFGLRVVFLQVFKENLDVFVLAVHPPRLTFSGDGFLGRLVDRKRNIPFGFG